MGAKNMDEHQKELLKNLPKIDEMMLRIEKRGNLLMLRAGDDRKNAHLRICQEQIELSGFVANELSAFSVQEGCPFFEQEVSGGPTHTSEQELSTAILPQPLRSRAGDGCG